MQYLSNEPEEDVWTRIAPFLDQAVASLNEKDRQAIVLRFYEGWNLREVGAALKTSEDAAHQRVKRALEKLRRFFVKRGVVATAAVIAGAISTGSVQAAPASLTASATATALQGGPLSAAMLALVNETLRMLAWAKLKVGLGIGATTVLAGGAVALALSTGTLSPAKILHRAQDKYAALASYSETLRTILTTELSAGAPGGGGTTSDAASVKLGRPGLYRIETEGASSTNQFALWSAGDGDYWLLMGEQFYRSRDEPNPDSIASPYLTDPTDMVPAAFFGKRELSPLAAMAASADLVGEPDESLNGIECYKLYGSANVLKRHQVKMTVWVGKADLLVRQVQVVTVREVQPPQPKKKAAKGGVSKPFTVTHTILQKHENISVNPAFSKADFSRAVPAGVQPSGTFP